MDSIPIATLMDAIRQLPADPPVQSGTGYETDKEHWLVWLAEYDGPGYYGRKTPQRRDARYAYNHLQNWHMLEWLIRAAGADAATNRAVRAAARRGTRPSEQAAAIRRVVPWERVAAMLWSGGTVS